MLRKVIFSFFFALVSCDVYFHNPRGSNNRLNENKRDRNNANRLFDSQNNARGGYNVGSVYFLVGSQLTIAWTNQHSCGNENNNCTIIVQYIKSDHLRDGATTSTIPENPKDCMSTDSNGKPSMDCNQRFKYGMHEDFYYYQECKQTKRNMGLYTADQNLNGKYSAKYTRQNRNGNRYGYECPEERDYYPYWRASPWRDLAVLTGDVAQCEFYRNESQNVKNRQKCEVPYQYLYKAAMETDHLKPEAGYIPITEEECVKFRVNYTDYNGVLKSTLGRWVNVSAHDIPPPECYEAPWSRDNHNGNGMGGHENTFNITIPDHMRHERVALRIRYNISTGEFPRNVDYNSNNKMKNIGPTFYEKFGLTKEQAEEREYELKNDPVVDVFGTGADKQLKKKFRLQLAVNTAQFGRTFQDRTYRIAVRERPSDLDCSQIWNLNVQGKRGNIVQVYPAVEYDFVPNRLTMTRDDCVHIQWTGSNNNNQANDGQGRAGTDRSNIVALGYSLHVKNDNTSGIWSSSYPSSTFVDSFGGKEDMRYLANLENNQFGGDMSQLDDAGTYYDLGPRKITRTGTYNYMCTRNNNFSNRSQKGKITVTDSKMASKVVGALGGVVAIPDKSTSITVSPGAFSSAYTLQLEHHKKGHNPIGSEPSNTDYVSGFVSLAPAEILVEDGEYPLMTIELDNVHSGLFDRHVYRTTDGETWHKLEIKSEGTSDSVVTFHTNSGGHFVVSKTVAPGPLAGLIIGLLAGVVIIGGFVYLCRNNKLPLAGYNSKI